ncbi:MAG TPA: cadherin-like domain-containing protein, partial [Pyrinomonadaceae bacterium]
MKSYIPRSSHSNLRVFNACLLSFLMIVMPLATLAASMRSSAPSALPASEAKPQPVQTENETKLVQAETKSESQHPSSTGFFNFFMPVGAVTATLTDSFPDPNGDGLADKGETITYTATINNGTASSITNTEFQDTPDPNTTLVGGSINVSPLAADDSYDTVANTLLEVGVAASGNPAVRVTDPTKDSVFDNDKEFLGDTFSFDTITVNPTKGTLTFNTDGTFSYQPNANQTGTDTFTYRIKDSQGLTDTATVTININATKVWYVKNNVAGAGTGTSSDPFKALASAAAASSAGDTIYISNGDGTTSQQNAGITLKANQRLIGEATQLDVPVSLNGGPNPTVLKTATANYPKISGTTEGVSILNVTGVLVSGLNIAGTNAGSNAIDATTNGANSGGVEVANCIISAAGAEGIDVNGGGTGTMTVSIHNNTVTATGNGIDIARTAGSVNVIAFNDNTVTGTTGGAGINVVGTGAAVLFDATAGGAYNTVSFGTTVIGASGAGNGVGTNGIVLNNVAGDISFTDLDVFTDNGTALFVVGTNANFNAGTATGTRITANTGTPTLTAVGGAALDVTSANINLGSNTAISSTNSASTGVSLAQTSGTFNGASGSSITNATGTDFSVNGGSNASANVGVSYAGTITDDVGQLVNIQNVTASSTHTFSGLITDNFDGDGTEQGISLTGNTGANITFSGGINIRTTTNAAFTSTGAGGTGTLTITDPAGATANKLQTTTGVALNVANTIIGSSGLTFESITAGTAASGPSNGIILNTTGSQGGLTVTGTGSAGTGGTIQKTTGDGVSLNSTEKLSLSWMNINNNLGSGIGGGTINGFQLDHCTLSTNGDNAATDESGINVTQLIGSASGGSRPTSITNCTFQNNWEFQIQITNSSGTLTDLTMSGNTISNNGANGIVGDLFNFLGNGTASMKLSLTSGTFTGNAPATATAISSVTQGSGTHTVNVSGATFTNNNVGVDCSTTNASTTFNCNVSNNTFTGSRAQAINSFHNGNSPFTRTFNGTFNNNIIGTLGVAGSGSAVGRGIDIDNEGAINATYTISGNTIQEVTNFEGISVQTGLGGSTTAGGLTQVTITNNTIRNINASRGLIVQELQDATKPPFPTLCANISGNSFSGIAGQAGNGQYMRVKEGSGTVNVTQATPTAAANASELDDANGFNDPTKISIGGAPSFSQPACTGSSAMLNIQSNGSNEQLAQAGDALQNSGAQPLFSLLGIKAELASVVAEFSNHPQTVATEQTSIGTQSSWLAALTATVERSGAHENTDALIQPGMASTHDQSGFASADISEQSGVTSIASQDKSVEYGAQIVKASYQPVAEELSSDTGRADVAARDTRLGHARSRSSSVNNSVKSSELSNVASPLPPTPVDVVIGTLPAGKSVTIKFQVTVNNPPTSPANATSVQTQGLVLFNSGSTVVTDDPATVASNDATITPLGRSDLAVTGVTDNATTTTPGSTQTYVISYSNPGRSTTGVVLSETVPVGTTFNPGASSPGWTCAPNNNAGSVCTNTIGALAHNASSTNNFAVTVNNPAASGLNTISDTASISGDTSYEADINPANDSANDTTTLNAAPAFGTFTKSDGVTTTTPTSTLTYTINYTNTGNQDAAGVVLTETVPTGTTFVAAGSSAWTGCSNGAAAGTVCTINVGNLAGGGSGSGSATFVVLVDSTVIAGLDNIVNNASIADDGTNTGGVPVTVGASDTDTLNAVPDLSITKSPDVTNASADTVITYTLNYANGGNQGATGVVVTETVPANTNFVAAGSSAGWSCADNSPAGTSCTNTVGALAGNGAGGSLTFKVKVVNPVPGGTTQITNTATIDDDHANGTDPTPANNTTGAVNTPVCQSNVTVTSTNDSGAGSLRQAIADACPGATIDFNIAGAGPHTITLTSGELAISKNLTIQNTSGKTIIVSGNDASRIFNVGQNLTVSISNLTATHGSATGGSSGGAIVNNEGSKLTLTGVTVSNSNASGGGGGIANLCNSASPTLILEGSTVSGNTANGDIGGGGIYHECSGTLYVDNSVIDGNHSTANAAPTYGGGGISVNAGALLSVSNSTISNNTAIKNAGGIYTANSTASQITLINSTLSGNSANANGGGLYGRATMVNTTVTNNRADADGDNNGTGGGLYINGLTVSLLNSIVAGNFHGTGSTSDDINTTSGGSATGSFNLIGTGGSGGLVNGTNNNQVGVADAKLGALANNGGSTQTHGLLAGSPAIEAGTDVTTLNGGINNVVTSVIVADASSIPDAVNFRIQVDDEQMTVTAKSGNTLTVTRGAGGTTAASHSNGAAVNPAFDQRGTTFPRKADSADANTTQTVDIGAYEAHPTVEDITDKSTNEDTPFNFNFNIGDGVTSPSLISSVTATSNNAALVPNANLSVTGSGATRNLAITPVADANTPSNGTATITVTVTATNGQTATDTFVLTVNPVADTPSVTGASTFVNLQTSSGLVISRNGADGAEVGFFKITNIQNGTLFKNDGTTQISNGSFITFAEGNAGLKFTPTTDSTASGSFDVQGSIDNAGTGLSAGAATATITVSKSGTTTTVTSSMNPSFTNQTVTFTATVASSTAYAGPPTGNVDFFDNGSVTPITGCSARPLDGSGVATCQTNALSVGNHTITATYNGDAAFNPSNGSLNTNPQVVNPSLSLTVNDTADTHDANVGDGLCADLNGKCTLRAALEETNAIPSDDAISFDTAAGHAFDPATAPHTITLDDTNGALPAIDGNLTITGPGANTLTVQRSSLATSDIRIFAINSGKTVSISGLTMSGGKVAAAGGGILNNGTLTLTDAVVSGNDISSGSNWGGGIFNGGTLIVTNTTVSGNTGGSGGSAGGGGIFNSGTLTVTNSTVSGNSAGTTGPGGGIYSTSGTLTLVNSTVSGNTTPTNGGGIYSDSGTATLTNVTVTNNRADNDNNTTGTGGGIN